MNLRVAWVVLGVSLLLVAGRTLVAAQSALRFDGAHSRAAALHRQQETLVFDATRTDSLVRNTPTSVRNPFAAPPPRIVAAPAPRNKPQPPAPAPVTPPRVNLLIQDGNSTVVQIEVNGETSGRMNLGATF